MQSTDSVCPEGELYIRWISQGTGSAVSTVTNDMKVRNLDKAQFFTGTFTDTTPHQMCFFAKLDRKGNIQGMSYIRNTNYQNEYTTCHALTLTENNDWIVVGNAADGVGKVAALIVMLDDDLVQTPQIKIWSNSVSKTMGTPYQEAHAVATTVDGGIFVTGFIQTAFTIGGYDCYVLRLNYTLDVIYAKSFGTADNEQCYSIQVTRNYDYIYLGGVKYLAADAYREMIFYKFNSYTDSGIAVSLVPNTNSDTLLLKNILLTQKNTFSGINDQNTLYFCGQTTYTGNTGDIIIGTVTSTSLSAMTVSQVYRYGSKHRERIADCVLTEDNKYMLVLFNTRHYIDYETYTGTYRPIPITYTYSRTPSNPETPGSISDPYSAANVYGLIYNYHDIIRRYCEDTAYNELTEYVSDYRNYIYSWTTCDFYIHNYNALDCRIADVRFSQCDRNSGDNTGSLTTYFPYADCSNFLGSINTFKPWYNTQYTPNYCRNDQFKKNVWDYVFGNGNYSSNTNSSRYMFYAQAFCVDNNGTQTNNFCDRDDFNFLFEQDCTGDSNRGDYDNWFIIKFDVTTMTVASFPNEAAYFGDRDGHTTAYAMDVDDAGFIYLSGTSSSARLGSVSNEDVWLYAKTHWRMTFESRPQQTSSTYDSRSPYLNKRFIKPQKYRNSDNGREPAKTTSGGTYTAITFTVDFLSEATVQQYNITLLNPTIYSYQINERIFSTYEVNPGNINLYTYSTVFQADKSLSTNLMADTFNSMDFFPPIIVGKSSTYAQYIALPQMCHLNVQGSGSTDNLWRINYISKNFEVNSGVGGFTLTMTSDTSSTPYLSGTVISNEGIYYTWIQGNLQSFNNWVFTTPNYPDYDCPYEKYGYWMDSSSFHSLRRYEYSIRLKIIVDDPQVPPPENAMNIPDVTPTVGQRFEIANIDTYFTTTCAYYKVKRNKLLTATTGTNFNTTMIPYWMMFYEQNKTFEMYPEYTGAVYIDVFCYNNIDQFVVNTFMVSPVDTTPVNYYGTGFTPYTIQYDAYSNVGQYISWSQSLEKFNDSDSSSDALDVTYKHTNHTVWLTFLPAYVNGFNHIKWIGMLFGQAVKQSSSNIGAQTFNYQFQDQYSLNSIPTANFMILINQQPSPTAVGLAYKFKDIDPTEGIPTTYFDDYFPFVQDNYYQDVLVVIATATWFTEADLSDPTTYSLTYSDDTDRPNWMGYDITSGVFRGYPMIIDSSEYMNLKFTAYDTHSGEYSYYKTLLVNIPPMKRSLFKTLYMGVGRQYAYNFSTMVYDIDGDYLTWNFKNSADQTTLQNIGLDFYRANKLLSGIPIKTGVIAMIPLVITDPHGYYATIYFTVYIKNYQVMYRDAPVYPQYPDRTVTVSQPFCFCLNNHEFWDPGDQQPLVLFASTLYDVALPDWLQFEPTTRCFYGTAPDKVQNLTVQVTAANQFSQDTDTDSFILRVIGNNNPKMRAQYLNSEVEVEIYKNEWFETTLPIRLFIDKEDNRNATLSMSGGYGSSLPEWLSFNHDNRTIYGQGKDAGVFWVDVQYIDDGGLGAYTNVRIKVLDLSRVNKNKIILNYIFMAMTMIASITLMSWVLHFNMLTYRGYEKENRKEIGSKIAAERFGEYKDVEVLYHMPKYQADSQRVFSSVQNQLQQRSVHTYNSKSFRQANLHDSMGQGELSQLSHYHLGPEKERDQILFGPVKSIS